MSAYRKVDDIGAQILDEFCIEVPSIVKALAERLTYEGLCSAEASGQARDMVALAMDDPDRFNAVFGEVYH
jgi:hypothetical protein